MNKDIKFIFFDVGGVFFKWDKAFETAANTFSIDMDRMINLFDEVSEKLTLGSMSPTDFWSTCIQRFNIEDAVDFAFVESWVGDYVSIQPMHDLARRIESKYKVGVISNFYQDMYELTIQENFIPNLKFNPTVISCDVGMKKPNQDIFEYAQEMIGVAPNQILFIDDQEKNVATALEMGWYSFRFDTYNSSTSTKELGSLLKLN